MKSFKSHLYISFTAALPVLILVGPALAAGASAAGASAAVLNQPPEGFVALFNGKDLTGWKGLLKSPYDNPSKRAKLSPDRLKQLQKDADEDMQAHWKIADGVLVFDGKGHSLCTAKNYGDFEMLVDWKIESGGDSGIYLRGSPQVQIWDTALKSVGAEVGSGGLYNNKQGPSKPFKKADKPVGQWNTFRIIMVGDVVTVFLNDVPVVDNVALENYWEPDKPIYPTGQIELQSHGSKLYFKNIFIKPINELTEQEIADGFKLMFNGRDLTGWVGNTQGYKIENGIMICDPSLGGGGNLYTADEYSDFIMRFEFQLTPGANNGLGIRTPMKGDPAYVGMELQILDNPADKFRNLKDCQYHGSIYGVVPAKRGYLKPAGQWNCQEVIADGRQIRVRLNGTTILDADIDKAGTPKTIDGRDHPGLKRSKGHICFCGHGDKLAFRNLRIKVLG